MPSSYSRVAATRAQLIRLIDDLDAGAALPPERELARRCGVARMTLRRATDDLVLAGRIVREQGRGTFVQPKTAHRQLAMTSFTEATRERGMAASSRLLDFRTLHSGGPHSRPLRIPADEPVIRFTRLRLADGQPIGLETTWVAAREVPGLAAVDLDGSWYALLLERYGLQVMTGSSVIDIAYASRRDAAELACEPDAPLFRIQTTTYGSTGHVIDFALDRSRGDRYSLATERAPGAAIRGRPRTGRPPAGKLAAPSTRR